MDTRVVKAKMDDARRAYEALRAMRDALVKQGKAKSDLVKIEHEVRMARKLWADSKLDYRKAIGITKAPLPTDLALAKKKYKDLRNQRDALRYQRANTTGAAAIRSLAVAIAQIERECRAAHQTFVTLRAQYKGTAVKPKRVKPSPAPSTIPSVVSTPVQPPAPVPTEPASFASLENFVADYFRGYRVWVVRRTGWDEKGRVNNVILHALTGGMSGQRSYAHGTNVWTPRQKFVATCHAEAYTTRNRVKGGKDQVLYANHVAPDGRCYCGIWMLRFFHLAAGMRSAGSYSGKNDCAVVIGQVNGWGKYVQGTEGWRVQFAYPWQIWYGDAASTWMKGEITEDDADAIRNVYGIDVTKMGDKEFNYRCSQSVSEYEAYMREVEQRNQRKKKAP